MFGGIRRGEERRGGRRRGRQREGEKINIEIIRCWEIGLLYQKTMEQTEYDLELDVRGCCMDNFHIRQLSAHSFLRI